MAPLIEQHGTSTGSISTALAAYWAKLEAGKWIDPAPLPAAQASVALAPECTLEEFQKIDLRVAEIVEAETVPDARKLLKLTLNLGDAGQKTVFAGIKGAYAPEQLRGRLVVMLANLKPRTMKFGVSEGMVLAAGNPDEDVSTALFLLAPDSGARPGFRIS